MYARARELKLQRLAEEKNESLGRGVGRYMGEWLKARVGCEVDDAALATFCHTAAKQVGEGDDRLNVDLDRGLFFLKIVREEAAGQPQPCVVDQQVYLNVTAFEFRADLHGGFGSGQVGIERDALHAVPGCKAFRQGIQNVTRPGYQHEVHATCGKDLREDLP